jgi:predicted O-methyltransferase YrrM
MGELEMSYGKILEMLFPTKAILHTSNAILSAPVRHVFMIATIWYLRKKCSRDSISILEIGSWFGASALSWAQGINKYYDGKGSITCVDAWAPFFNSTPDKDVHYAKEMDEMLESDIAYEIFLHNMKTISKGITTQHLRGQSENISPQLRSEYYDVVFIDANHTFDLAQRDILNSQRLVKDGGIICGDDLNLQLHESDRTFVEKHADRDTVIDPLSGRKCHPGVTLAVAKVFGKVSTWAGFWAMQKSGSSWKQFKLKDMPVVYPDHFPKESLQRAKEHFHDIEHLI